jgi:anti-sigma B factor antagonist
LARIRVMGVKDQLRIVIDNEATDLIVVALDGELDMASGPLLQSALEGDEVLASPTVVLDLNQLEFLDSTGLRIILAAREHCRERNQAFAVTRGSQQVQRLLSVTGVDEHLRTVATPGEMHV